MNHFERAAAVTLDLEAGYQALKADTGNYNSKRQLVGTKYGISARTLETYLKRPPTAAEMKALKLSTALAIYKLYFWDSIKLDGIKDYQLASFIFDYGINGGAQDAVRGLVRAWNKTLTPKVKPLTTITPTFAKMINQLDAQKTAKLFAAVKNERIFDIQTQGTTVYDDSLINRVNKFTYELIETTKDEVKKKPFRILIITALAITLYKILNN